MPSYCLYPPWFLMRSQHLILLKIPYISRITFFLDIFFSLLFFWNICYFDMLDGVPWVSEGVYFSSFFFLSVPQIRQFQLNCLQVFWCFRLIFRISCWAALVNFLFQCLQFSNPIFFTTSLYWYSFLDETLLSYLVLIL